MSEIVQSESRRVAEQMEFFSFLPIFKEWPSKTLRNVTYIVPVSKFQRGFKVYKEGDTPEKMYIVKKGEFKVKTPYIYVYNTLDPQTY